MPSLDTWRLVFASVGAAAVGWVTAVTTFESGIPDAWGIDPGLELPAAVVVAVLAAGAVWTLGRRTARRNETRRSAFAERIRLGSELIELVRRGRSEGLTHREGWAAELDQRWRDWDEATYATVARYGSAYELEVYSQALPAPPPTKPLDVPQNVQARMDRVGQILARIEG
jgi:type II secretory pathway pseudopilin PulG